MIEFDRRFFLLRSLTVTENTFVVSATTLRAERSVRSRSIFPRPTAEPNVIEPNVVTFPRPTGSAAFVDCAVVAIAFCQSCLFADRKRKEPTETAPTASGHPLHAFRYRFRAASFGGGGDARADETKLIASVETAAAAFEKRKHRPVPCTPIALPFCPISAKRERAAHTGADKIPGGRDSVGLG